MTRITSNVSVTSGTYQANRAGMQALLDRVHAYEARAQQKSAASRARFEKRGQMLPRERIALLLENSPPWQVLVWTRPTWSVASLGAALLRA